jgi:hypothetical protein
MMVLVILEMTVLDHQALCARNIGFGANVFSD